ncbi:riboflavin biosynthesis protein RibF [Oceanivirga salmonicida]|uniref:riboflavin biosynthesis protein RibF n=1 Tax=Oceanivirga salmonicida TaxID=1769291 RepID=UPI000836091F|nr:riboflavin biosynthesis protein RibF [Oceanivirga salmonicida]
MKNLVILGNFDGVHIGHQNLISSAVEYARKNNLRPIVYTFSTLSKNKEFLTTINQRKELIYNLGVDEVIIDDFDRVKMYTAKEFVEKILKKELNAKVVFCGYNYKFAYMKEGNVEILKDLIETIVFPEFRLENELVSSSKIRELLYIGDIYNASKLLGRNLEYRGIVVKGRQLGRLIGFPTANIKITENKIRIPNGVYGSYTKIEGYEKEFLSITNIGTNPTISDNNELNIETHILDFKDNIYDKKIKVRLCTKIRNEVKFSTIEDLKKQINIDTNKWRIENVKYSN